MYVVHIVVFVFLLVKLFSWYKTEKNDALFFIPFENESQFAFFIICPCNYNMCT